MMEPHPPDHEEPGISPEGDIEMLTHESDTFPLRLSGAAMGTAGAAFVALLALAFGEILHLEGEFGNLKANEDSHSHSDGDKFLWMQAEIDRRLGDAKKADDSVLQIVNKIQDQAVINASNVTEDRQRLNDLREQVQQSRVDSAAAQADLLRRLEGILAKIGEINDRLTRLEGTRSDPYKHQ